MTYGLGNRRSILLSYGGKLFYLNVLADLLAVSFGR